MVLLEGETLADLRGRFSRRGVLEWIGIRPSPGENVVTTTTAMLRANFGIDGDHRGGKPGSKRQVTLIQWEYLSTLAAFCGRNQVDPAELRRNLAVSAINLNALKDRRFRIGDAMLEGTGPCHPCSRMERALGEGGYNAMRGHGGITARILETGVINVGDPVAAFETSLTDG